MDAEDAALLWLNKCSVKMRHRIEDQLGTCRSEDGRHQVSQPLLIPLAIDPQLYSEKCFSVFRRWLHSLCSGPRNGGVREMIGERNDDAWKEWGSSSGSRPSRAVPISRGPVAGPGPSR